MPPGPKRKGKKDTSRGKVKHPDACNGYNNQINNGSLPKEEASRETEVTDFSEGTAMKGKYARRKVQSNWERYEERSPGLFEDTMRGDSFEVLSSYQGGSDSYLKLKEEKEWSNAVNLQNGLYLDCEKLALSLKAIPLHERLHLPENCFTPEMIKKFKEVAAKNHPVKLGASTAVSYMKNDKSALCPSSSYKPNELSEENQTVRNDPPKFDSSQTVSYTKVNTSLLCPTSTFEVPDTSSKPKEVNKETEDIILSLTQCISLKGDSQQATPAALAAPASLSSDVKSKDDLKSVTQDDDLAALLSLSGLNKQPDVKEQQSSSASIEDWLNELLNK